MNGTRKQQVEKLTFGVNPYDKCPDQIGRFHVVTEDGFIVAKTRLGFSAYGHAGNLSDRTPDHTFTAIDTADGSVYGAYRNGEDVEI